MIASRITRARKHEFDKTGSGKHRIITNAMIAIDSQLVAA
jgi:hypothetical protein